MKNTDPIKEAEKFLRNGKIRDAENVLLTAEEHTAEYYYLQSEIDYAKGWTNECRKNLEKALELEPENAKYKDVYDKITMRVESADMSEPSFENPYGKKNKKQMGSWKDACGEACCEGSCMCCAEGICGGICDGLG